MILKVSKISPPTIAFLVWLIITTNQPMTNSCWLKVIVDYPEFRILGLYGLFSWKTFTSRKFSHSPWLIPCQLLHNIFKSFKTNIHSYHFHEKYSCLNHHNLSYHKSFSACSAWLYGFHYVTAVLIFYFYSKWEFSQDDAHSFMSSTFLTHRFYFLL